MLDRYDVKNLITSKTDTPSSLGLSFVEYDPAHLAKWYPSCSYVDLVKFNDVNNALNKKDAENTFKAIVTMHSAYSMSDKIMDISNRLKEIDEIQQLLADTSQEMKNVVTEYNNIKNGAVTTNTKYGDIPTEYTNPYSFGKDVTNNIKKWNSNVDKVTNKINGLATDIVNKVKNSSNPLLTKLKESLTPDLNSSFFKFLSCLNSSIEDMLKNYMSMLGKLFNVNVGELLGLDKLLKTIQDFMKDVNDFFKFDFKFKLPDFSFDFNFNFNLCENKKNNLLAFNKSMKWSLSDWMNSHPNISINMTCSAPDLAKAVNDGITIPIGNVNTPIVDLPKLDEINDKLTTVDPKKYTIVCNPRDMLLSLCQDGLGAKKTIDKLISSSNKDVPIFKLTPNNQTNNTVCNYMDTKPGYIFKNKNDFNDILSYEDQLNMVSNKKSLGLTNDDIPIINDINNFNKELRQRYNLGGNNIVSAALASIINGVEKMVDVNKKSQLLNDSPLEGIQIAQSNGTQMRDILEINNKTVDYLFLQAKKIEEDLKNNIDNTLKLNFEVIHA